MSRYLRYAIRALRLLIVIWCLTALVGSLVMWPRSYFHEDGLLVFPPNVRGDLDWRLNIGAVNCRMGKFAAGWKGGVPASVEYHTRQYPDRERRYEMLHPTVPEPISVRWEGLLWYFAVDFWVLIAASLLLLYVATRPSWKELIRFRVSHLLCGTVAVAMMVVASQINGRPAYAMVGQWVFLAIACITTAHRSLRGQGRDRWLWASVSLIFFAGLLALAIFYKYCVATVEPLA